MNAQEINRTFDLKGLVSGLTTLHQSGAYEIGRCPLPGCTSLNDALNLKQTPGGWIWICRKCGVGKYQSSIDFYMRLYNLDFRTAFAQMSGNYNVQNSPKNATAPSVKHLPKTLKALPDTQWQLSAWEVVDKNLETLLRTPEGKLGRDYFLLRGIKNQSLAAWRAGFYYHYDPKLKRKRPAVTLPWYECDGDYEQITAVKIRFIDQTPTVGSRYIMLKGSVPVLYGLWDVLPTTDSLLLVEGEINAISIWQLHPNRVAVLSIGSDTGANPDILRVLAKDYKICVWLDDESKAKELRSLLPGSCAVKSPIIGGIKWDANQMLQAGELQGFLSYSFNMKSNP
ncbi:MAG: toprim domain-containing protein [Chloroflexota bacterium]